LKTAQRRQPTEQWMNQLRSSDAQPVALLRWWYSLSAPPPVSPVASFAARERVRRGQIASLILLGLLALVVLSLPEFILTPTLRPSIAILTLCCLAAIPINRGGNVTATAIVLLVMVDLAVIGALLIADGGLDPLYLPAFYLLVTSELIAVSLLKPISVFIVAIVQSLFILIDVQTQAHTMMWEQMITTPGIFYSLVAGPIALHLIVALVSYLWVRSAEAALRRADRAEEIALLERREIERTNELRDDVRQLLEVHVQLSNGDFNTRAPTLRNRDLWQIGNSLNNLIARLARFSQAASQSQVMLQRMQQEAQRIAQAIYSTANGHRPHWPNPSGTTLDAVVDALRNSGQRLSANYSGHTTGAPPVIPTPYPAPESGFPAQWSWETPAYDDADLPEWLRPPRQAGGQ
jgi:hypothetical protein